MALRWEVLYFLEEVSSPEEHIEKTQKLQVSSLAYCGLTTALVLAFALRSQSSHCFDTWTLRRAWLLNVVLCSAALKLMFPQIGSLFVGVLMVSALVFGL